MNRRNFIHTSGLSLAPILISDSIYGSPNGQLINFPDEVSAILNGQSVKLAGKGQQIWSYQQLIVSLYLPIIINHENKWAPIFFIKSQRDDLENLTLRTEQYLW